MSKDQLDRAVAAAMAEPPAEKRGQVSMGLPGGREATIDVPADLTQGEALLIISFIANGLAAKLGELAAKPVLEAVRGGLRPV